VRVYGGTAFRLDAHLDRLAHAAAALEIALPADVRATALAAVAEGPASASLRITLSRGPGAGGAAPPPVAGPATVVVHGRAARALPARALRARARGARGVGGAATSAR
jgi:branched-subunit amino acid aminotransferase/4-amino-4-deoxychorismate lyase